MTQPAPDARTDRPMTTGQVATLFGVTARTVAKWFDTGLLPGYRLPGGLERRFRPVDVENFKADRGFYQELGLVGIRHKERLYQGAVQRREEGRVVVRLLPPVEGKPGMDVGPELSASMTITLPDRPLDLAERLAEAGYRFQSAE